MRRIWTEFFIKKKREETMPTGVHLKRKAANRHHEERLFNDLESLMNVEKPFLRHELSRRDLANAVRTNECYLAAAIRQFAGKTINEYINGYRLEYAANQLMTKGEELTIESIAYESGFSTLRHFYRLFQSKYNISPAKYKRQLEEVPA